MMENKQDQLQAHFESIVGSLEEHEEALFNPFAEIITAEAMKDLKGIKNPLAKVVILRQELGLGEDGESWEEKSMKMADEYEAMATIYATPRRLFMETRRLRRSLPMRSRNGETGSEESVQSQTAKGNSRRRTL
ncbi:hypothetical protein OCU04_010967 [Sclerotinia nivalis]|uniref:Uncharacterized protein n=1 Tax=Sclerotinia nivalis TaxID=352851 RepID=A0A9X0AD69_9HELO|nr:hypothetical protein OCU04_010967 [Sclerotinia nivalis]